MKKILLLFCATALVSLTGCHNDDNGTYVDNDTIAEVFEVNAVNFNAAGNYQVYIPLDPVIYTSDVVLVYRQTGLDSANNPIWEIIPSHYVLGTNNAGQDEYIDFNYDFSLNSVAVYFSGNIDLTTVPQFGQNQTFRIVLVPGAFSKSATPNDYSDYNATIKRFGLENTAPKTIQVKK